MALAPVIDLHTHSNHSDGTQSPGDVVRSASQAGLDVVALTDHDVASGWAEADAVASEVGLLLVPGIEVSCKTALGISVHMLAYRPDPLSAAFLGSMEQVREFRADRLRRQVDLLRKDGFRVELAEMLAHAQPGATLGRPHLADALVRAGHFANRDEAFAQILGAGKPYYLPVDAPDPVDVVQMIRAAGGVPVMAHPFASLRGRVVSDAVIHELTEAGLAGLEADHRDHDEAARKHARQLAATLGLLVTGSSDYHGTGKLNALAENTSSLEVLEALMQQGTGSPLMGTGALPTRA
ncbi:PHP domain-containing protein [Ornithinimicrobium sp. Arc0846-15]|nr:PHP domain-containing protein [Ornithinimicrobium laminariae]